MNRIGSAHVDAWKLVGKDDRAGHDYVSPDIAGDSQWTHRRA